MIANRERRKMGKTFWHFTRCSWSSYI